MDDTPVMEPATYGGASSDDGTSTAVFSTSSSSSSGVNWQVIVLLLLALLAAIVLLSCIASIVVKHNIRKRTGQTVPEKDEACRKVRVRMQWVATLTAFIAFAISIATNTSCSLVVIASNDLDYRGALRSFGLWSVSLMNNEHDVCSSAYPTYFVMDSAYKAARAFAVLAAISGGLVFVLLLHSLRDTRAHCQQSYGKYLSFAKALCLGPLAFLAFRSDMCAGESTGFNCHLEFNGTLTILGIGYWLLTGIALR